MTDREKAKFLRAEGWVYRKSRFPDVGGLFWSDPSYSVSTRTIDIAYRIAKRRKAARDRARLKRAGYEFTAGCGYYFPPFKLELGRVYNITYYTKAQALASLEGR